MTNKNVTCKFEHNLKFIYTIKPDLLEINKMHKVSESVMVDTKEQ